MYGVGNAIIDRIPENITPEIYDFSELIFVLMKVTKPICTKTIRTKTM